MKQYDNYKDSGIEWIGEVPEHWDVIKTSIIYDNIGSGTTPSSSNSMYYTEGTDGFFWLQTGDLNDGQIWNTSKKVTKLAVKECKLKFYPVNSVVIAMYGATIGKVGLLKIETSTNQACCVLPKSKKMKELFSFYLYQAAKQPMILEAIGGGQPNISQDIIKRLKVPVPPLSEQQQIVNYIVKQMGNLDKAISQQQRMIDLLNERKQIIIQQAVTKGLNPNVKMKDSCNNVIGDFSQQWQIMPIKYAATFFNGYAFNSNAFNSNDNGIPVIRIGDITEEGIIKEELVYVDENPKLNPFKILCGDILIAMSGATTGKVCCVKAEDSGYINQRVGIIRGNNNSWIMYCLKSLLFRKYVDLCAFGSAQPNISASGIMNFKICLPPQDERKKIILYLEKEETKIDNIIARCNRQIALLKERKQIIINEAVTGKIKVI